MSTLEEIQQMQQSGMNETEIIARLQEQGISYREISESLAQARIKAAVEGQANGSMPLAPPADQTAEQAMINQLDPNMNISPPQGMQPSLLQSPQAQVESEQQEYFPAYDQNTQTAGGYDYSQQGYDYTSAALSSDTITEISEQIVSEKLSDIRKKMERLISIKTELEAKTESIEERLKRIEKIIDSLQSSVLRKVGDYVTNVDDIKKELIETQKTIGKAIGSKRTSSSGKERKK
ncbi:MAG: hypothetical protein AABY16_01430 [Nanoarchaeota archaeon]